MSTHLPAERRNRLPVPRPRGDSDAVIGAFESETVAVFADTAPRRQHLVLYVLVIMLVLAVTLASIGKLDRVVTSTGKIVPTAGSLYISPLDSGIVRRVNVKVGDIVKKGAVLATLDPTNAVADVSQLKDKLESDSAEAARLQAEHKDLPYQPADDSQYSKLQYAIWEQRQAEYRSMVAGYDAQEGNARATIAEKSKDVAQYRKRVELAENVKGMYEPLLAGGYVSKLQWVNANDTREEVSRLLADAENQIVANRETASSVAAQRRSYVEKWHGDVGKDLVTVENDREDVTQKLAKAEKTNELQTLVAPADAVVLRIGKISTGSTAGMVTDSSGEALFTLTPLDAPLEAEVQVPASDIGFIAVGQPVQIKLDAYRFTQHGTGKGVIKTISDGSFTVDENNQPVKEPYFKVRVRITEMHLRNVPADFHLIPGMTMAGDIMIGRRTILSYLIEGALRTGSEAMREPS